MENQKCKKCGSKNIIMVEYLWDSLEHYDGISEIDRNDCKARFGRWLGKELSEGGVERLYGGKELNLAVKI